MPAISSIITTRDGRDLEYLQTGPPDGPALVFHVGTPQAAIDFEVVTGPAIARGLQTICYSRPGYGDSTAQPGRRVAGAANDVADLLDALGVERFRTLGWSGGGPHALACAALLPERCQAAAVLAGVAPYPARGIDFMQGMDRANVEEFGAALAGAEALQAHLTPMLEDLRTVTGASVVQSLDTLLPPVDQAALTGAFADQTAEAFRRAVATGVAGWRDDDLAFVRGWGFALSSVTVPVAIWHGRQDRMVPFAHGQWLAAELPTAEAHLFAEGGHLSLIAGIGSILDTLVASG